MTRTGVLLILVGHLLACAAVVWLMPGGWPWTSAPMYVYRLLPIVMGVLILASLLLKAESLRAKSIDLLRFLWLAGAGWCLYEASPSFVKLGIVAFLVGIVLIIASRHQAVRMTWRGTAGMLAVSVAMTSPVIHVLRSPAPSTVPHGQFPEDLGSLEPVRTSVQIGDLARLDPTQANITFTVGRRFVQVEPLLTFGQRSPDATWTVLASRSGRRQPDREYDGLAHRDGAVVAGYTDRVEGESVLADSRLTITPVNSRSFAISADTRLWRPVFSHLNTFTQVTLAGHKRLRIAFSAIPGRQFDVMYAGYPAGSPAQFVYVGTDRRLHIARARSGEKGPFSELGSGDLEGPLVISFFDGDEPIFDVELIDWADQASTELSPAAGWSVPQNAIEFGLLSEDPRSPATIFVSLASTSVGRGWSSVGHAEGVYRNRIVIRTAR